MNIFNKVALQGLRKNRARTLVTIVGVVLSAAMVTAVATFGVSLLSYMTKGAAAKYGGWHAAFPDADAAFVQEQEKDDRAADVVTLENIGYAALEGDKDGAKPYLFLTGYSDEAFQALPVTLFSGRLPENDHELLVSGKVAAETGAKLAVGDTVTLTMGKRVSGGKALWQSDPFDAQNEAFVPTGEKTYTVVGVCQRPHFEAENAPGYTLITKIGADDPAESYALFVTLKDPSQVHAYAEAAAQGRAYQLNDYVLRFMGLSEDSLFNSLLYAVGGIVVAIIMIGSVFLIYNAFSISLNERTQQLGILMSVGATARQLRNAVLFEGLCIGAVGIPAGIAAGIGCTDLLIDLVAKNFSNVLYTDVPLSLTVSVPALIGAALVSLVTILLSAYIPARKAVRMPVMECIRQTNEIKAEAKTVRTSALTKRLCGLEGMLALKNAKRNQKRYRSIVLSLVLSVVLFISASAFVTDMKLLSGQTAEVTTYDLAFTSRDMNDKALLALFDSLSVAPGVTESACQADASFICTAEADDLTEAYRAFAGIQPGSQAVLLPMTIQFLDEAAYLRIVRKLGLPEAEYAGQDAKLIAIAQLEQGDGYTDLFSASNPRLSIRPLGTDEAANQSVAMTFAFFVPPDTLPVMEAAEPSPVLFQVMAPYDLKARFGALGGAERMKGMTFRSDAPSKTADDMENRIQGAGVAQAYSLYNMSGLMEENRNYVFIANVFSYTFIVMISLIAIANVFNTISTNIKMRRRELAMLRSVGMSERAFQKMMNFECAFYGLRALLVGLPVSLACSWLIYRGMFIGGADGISFTLPWASIGVSVFSVLAIVFITMLYATRKIKKENIIDALRDDMT